METLCELTDEDTEKVLSYMQHFDLLIMTHYTPRDVSGGTALIQRVLDSGKPVIVVTNSPLPKNSPTGWPTVVATYGAMPPVLNVAAKLIYGRFQSFPPTTSSAWDPLCNTI